jgi:hypothetical protein
MNIESPKMGAFQMGFKMQNDEFFCNDYKDFDLFSVSYEDCRWVDSIKIDLREIGWDGMDWIDLAKDRGQWRALVNTVMKFQVP